MAMATSSYNGRLSEGGLTAVVTSFIFTFLATVAVILRFWVRTIKRKGFFLDDWIILVALILEWSYVAVVFLLAFDGGLGWPTEQVAPETLVNSSKYSLAGQTNWPIANGLIKLSICLTFIRIFYTKTFRIVATIVYSLSLGWSAATLLVGYCICIPLSQLWLPTSSGHCGSTRAAYVALGVLDIVLDMAVFSLPMPSLYKLQIPRSRKISLIATIALGLFTIVAGIMRLVAVIQIDFTSDFSQGQVGDAYWCAIEGSVGTVVACCLTLRPLLKRARERFGRHIPRLSTKNVASHSSTISRHATNSHKMSSEEGTFVRIPEGLELSLR